MTPIKIDKYTGKLILIFCVSTLVIALVWFLLYSKISREIKYIKEQTGQLDEAFNNVRDIMIKSGAIGSGLIRLQRDYLSLKSKFPGRQQDIMKELSRIAHDHKLIVSSIIPATVNMFSDAEGGDFRIGKASCNEVKFNIIAYGSFFNIGEYFNALTTGSFPFTVRVDLFDIKKASSTAGSVQVNIALSAYLLSE